MPALTLRARQDRYLEVWWGARRLCRYRTRPYMTALQGPRPYFHPVSTLDGLVVTQEKHYDHEWHNGISLACPWVSGFNFWGGPTYVRGRGYRQLPNLGRQVHQGLVLDAPAGAAPAWRRWTQRLHWRVPDPPDALCLEEERRLGVGDVRPAEGYWCLDFDFALFNPGPADVTFGSPTTEGRPMAGYGGVFWRGPLDILDGVLLAPEGQRAAHLMGHVSPWMAYVGRSRSTGREATVALLDHPRNVRFPLKWFVRTTPFPVASYAFSFDAYLVVPPRGRLERRHRIAICDGARTHEDIERIYRAWMAAAPADPRREDAPA